MVVDITHRRRQDGPNIYGAWEADGDRRGRIASYWPRRVDVSQSPVPGTPPYVLPEPVAVRVMASMYWQVDCSGARKGFGYDRPADDAASDLRFSSDEQLLTAC